jgi:hypothetical protein
MGMKIILTTLVASSIIFVSGCNKTKKATANNEASQSGALAAAVESNPQQFEMEFNVEVESDGEQIFLNLNGEEQAIDLGDMMEFHTMGDDGQMKVSIAKMISGGDGQPMQWLQNGIGDTSNMDIEIIVNGEELDGDFSSLPDHIMRKIGDGENLDVQVFMTSEHMGDMPFGIHERIMEISDRDGHDMGPEIREHVMEMMRQGFHMPEGMNPLDAHRRNDGHDMGGHVVMRTVGGEGHEDMMRMHDQMIEMMGDREMPEEMRGMHERMMQMHDMQERRPEHMQGEMRFRDVPEEHEFMQELGMMDEMSYHLSELGAISMLGIHMIRDELEPEARLDALERIIDEAPNPSPARNAALIVSIETLQELSRVEEAADLMVELVLSNSEWHDDD